MGKLKTLTLALPLKVMLYHRKRDNKDVYWILNLNNFRNAHHRVLSDAKIKYTKLVREIIPEDVVGMFRGKRVAISFVYYHGNRRKCDPSNPVSIIEKFFCDAITPKLDQYGEEEWIGLIDEDNYQVLVRHDGWVFGGVDKENPRCEVTITEVPVGQE